MNFRERLAANTEDLAARYWARADVDELVRDRTRAVDELICEAWNGRFADAKAIALLAVGGYGRGELHPGSDIDLLILARSPSKHREQIEAFLRDTYDLGLEVGYAVRTPKECRDVAAGDITVATALLERRLLAGDEALLPKLERALASRKVWSSAAFFSAKRDEQEKRHDRYADVDYGLEPNVKSSPGGLRDHHTAMWVCLREFGTDEPSALVDLGVLTEQEKEWLVSGRRFLWWVRFGLHLLAGRKEDRLQFEHQRELARRLGYADTEARLGVERFMQEYYRHVGLLREVNDILLQHFDEEIFVGRAAKVEPLSERFQLRGDYIETTSEQVFAQHPPALLELFVLMANRRDIAGVRANTIRQIRSHLHLIDDEFRSNKEVNAHFVNLLKSPYMLVSTLTRMRRYGVLGRYIPEFGRVTGQMQHDLFHIYTVDAHTMMVIRNMRRFFYRSSEELFPVASHCVKKLPRIELLYIAGLFHDIAKGRGGDHSTLGASEVMTFCKQHDIPDSDAELVRWLVEKHLYMSDVAQREDIYDPDVVLAFAQEVKSERRLDYLYSLTVADINATNPNLWNSYRATLLRHLYVATRRALRRGLEDPIDKEASIAATRESAFEKVMAATELSASSINHFFDLPGDEFFIRHSARHIANVTRKLLSNGGESAVWVANFTPQVEEESLTEVYHLTQDRPGLFAQSTGALDQLGLSIFEANINTGDDGTCFNTYVVLDRQDQVIPVSKHAQLGEKLAQMLRDEPRDAGGGKRMTRQSKQLSRATEVTIENEAGSAGSSLRIIASDRPGLLAEIGELLQKFGVRVQRARINTLGDRVEDWFEIQDANGQRFEDQEAYDLSNALRQNLDWNRQQAL